MDQDVGNPSVGNDNNEKGSGGSEPPPAVRNETPVRRSIFKRIPKWVYVTTSIATGIGAAAWIEARNSYLQSHLFRREAANSTYTLVRGEGAATVKAVEPPTGPYDRRLGYTRLDEFGQSLTGRGRWKLTARASGKNPRIFGFQLFPVYNEKSQAGLKITDYTDSVVYEAKFPGKSYENFEAIPPLLLKSLLYVEDREVLNEDNAPTRNPAINWPRVLNALFGYGAKTVGIQVDRSGGSTLATQTEKFRHSPDGVTESMIEKLRQMMTASVRSYREDETPQERNRRIVLDYLNSVPMSAYPRVGEVHGFGDALSLWFGEDFAGVNRLMKQDERTLGDEDMRKLARAYRQYLSLVMAVKKPSEYLLTERGRVELQGRVDANLPGLARAGVISERLKNAVLAERVEVVNPRTAPRPEPPPREKAVDALRLALLPELGMTSLYDLDRLDMSARTTIDGEVTREVSRMLRDFTDPEKAAAAGMTGFRMLKPQTAANVIYTFTLIERLDGVNVVRVQTDNYNGPLNLNEGVKLEYGSTAKAPTLATQGEFVAEIHKKYAGRDPAYLKSVPVARGDTLTRWALNYLAAPDTDKSLPAMLEANLERTYSANPGQSFFTGGGVHYFNNFDGKDNGRIMSAREAFQRSVNLPFVHIMRENVAYTVYQTMKTDPAVFTDLDHPKRREYLEKFVHFEGQKFLWDAWEEQQGKSQAEVLAMLAARTNRTATPLAVVYRSVFPDAPYGDFEAFMRKECRSCSPRATFENLYEAHAPGKFDLNDRGYLTRPRVHPMDLWLAGYKAANPQATWSQAVAASAGARIEIYKWLLHPRNPEKLRDDQNNRIWTMLEVDAFVHIGRMWREMGFPFEKMVASLASALGASGYNPAGLAKFAGIVANDGIRQPDVRFTEIQFGEDTPHHRIYEREFDRPVRVLPSEVAQMMLREMQGVVQKGTARRAFESVKMGDGQILELGGKTGTGDNRENDEVKSRVVAFMFNFGRFHGVMTAYVEGGEAAREGFTSGLVVQGFKNLVPVIMPVIERAHGVERPVQAEPEKKPLLKIGGPR